MSSNPLADREAVLDCLQRQAAAEAELAELSIDALTPGELLDVLAERETATRARKTFDTTVLARLREQGRPSELGATSFAKALTGRLRIGGADARRRLSDADMLAPRLTLTGAPLAPQWPNVAAGVAAGTIGTDHLRIIGAFFAKLPARIDAATREQAEATLAELAAGFGPDQLRICADRLLLVLDPDGTFDERDITRRRSLTLGKQGTDGLTPIHGLLDPTCAAQLEVILAKLAAPGMCLASTTPDGTTVAPCLDGTPTDSQVTADDRTPAQRQHDGLSAACRALLASGRLGQLGGLPVTVVITTTLTELNAAASAVAGFPVAADGHAGIATTGGRTLLPLADVLKLMAHSHQALAIFDTPGRPLYFGRAKRVATADQRLLLYATDRGCTRPGCDIPAYLTEVHHANISWNDDGPTDIDNLALACPPDNRAVERDGWTTSKDPRTHRTTWHPPPARDHGQPRTNTYHHPERLIRGRDDDDVP